MIKRILRRSKRLLKQFIKRSSYPQTIVINETGFASAKFRIHSDTEKFRTLGFGGEREQLTVFFSYLKEDDIVYDIGASVGLTAVLAALACPKGLVIAFEPDGAIKQRLEANIKLNALNNITVLPYAVSHSNESIQFFSAGADNVSPSLTGQNVKNIQLQATLVQARSLDTLILEEQIKRPTVLKIDIEGAEYHALLGAKRLFQGDFGASPRLIYIELHPDFLPEYQTNLEEIRDLLKSFGYKCIWQIQREAQVHEIYLQA